VPMPRVAFSLSSVTTSPSLLYDESLLRFHRPNHGTKPHGRSRRILLGVNLDFFDIGSIADGGFFIKFHLRIKIDGFQWFFCGCIWSSSARVQGKFSQN
jgi:hypothetical protein